MGGGWPTFRFLKGGIPRAYPAWDLWILRVLTRSCISVGTGEDEKEARRCMSPRLPTFAKTKAQRSATRDPTSPETHHGDSCSTSNPRGLKPAHVSMT